MIKLSRELTSYFMMILVVFYPYNYIYIFLYASCHQNCIQPVVPPHDIIFVFHQNSVTLALKNPFSVLYGRNEYTRCLYRLICVNLVLLIRL